MTEPQRRQPSDTALVPVPRVFLRASTWVAFEKAAEDHGTTIAVLLSHLADRAVKKPREDEGGRRRYSRLTAERLALVEQLRAEGIPITRIAERLGISRGTIYNHLHQEVRR